MKANLVKSGRWVSRDLEIEDGPYLHDDGHLTGGPRVTFLRLDYRMHGGKWDCYLAEGKAPLGPSILGGNARQTRQFFPFMASCPGWVRALAALHRP
ncbi:hypothetical protein AB0O47_40090 [Streptomyces noursei]|uniref:hypothetical protein n=1 Tax=Streptomyces noursei TaxID=1971 RepID=UPI00344D4097